MILSRTVLAIMDEVLSVDSQAYAFSPAGTTLSDTSFTGYTQICTEMPIEDVREIARMVCRESDTCTHEHDCCGCWFMSSLGVLRMDYETLLVVENWGRNF